jgi:hypothetical protein
MCRENPFWGAPRIHGELLKLGINIGESSVSKYMLRAAANRCLKLGAHFWRIMLSNCLHRLLHGTHDPLRGANQGYGLKTSEALVEDKGLVTFLCGP